MKKTFMILAGLLISFVSLNGQTWLFITCSMNFEDNPCMEGSYYNIAIPGPNNSWQVCTPNKTVFDSAFSAPHAILTDSLGSYPVNDSSTFIIKFVPQVWCECAPVIGGYYKFDSDTLTDYGKIEFSLDHGTTWYNALSDTVIADWAWFTPKPVLTGRIHQWREFAAMVPYYNHIIDTIYYRFTFISDNIQTNREGWMLDDLFLIDHTEGIQNIASPDEISIYPNPAVNTITVSGKTLNPETDLSVYDILGQLRLQQTINQNQQDIDISGFSKGIYMVRVQSGDKYVVKRIVKE